MSVEIRYIHLHAPDKPVTREVGFLVEHNVRYDEDRHAKQFGRLIQILADKGILDDAEILEFAGLHEKCNPEVVRS